MKKPLVFKVWAGNMYTGLLTVTRSGVHLFRKPNGMRGDLESLHGYKKLNLVRI